LFIAYFYSLEFGLFLKITYKALLPVRFARPWDRQAISKKKDVEKVRSLAGRPLRDAVGKVDGAIQKLKEKGQTPGDRPLNYFSKRILSR
jgi:hypothetical protein